MPGISDPGGEVIAAAAAEGVDVFPVPGPCAAICALVGSGLPTAEFHFKGFLPPKQAARRSELRRLRGQRATLVFYVPPHAAAAVLADAAAELGGGRRACVARELTKVHEEFLRGSLGSLAADFASRDGAVKGEMVLVVEGAPAAVAAVAEAGSEAALSAAALSAGGSSAGIGGESSSGGDGGVGDSGNGDDGDGSSSSGAGRSELGAQEAAAAAQAGAGVAAAKAAAAGDSSALRGMLRAAIAAGEPVSSVSRRLAGELGIGRSQLYKLALEVQQEIGAG